MLQLASNTPGIAETSYNFVKYLDELQIDFHKFLSL